MALAKDLPADADDGVGVGVGLGKDEGLGNPVAGASWEEGGEEEVAEGSEDGADLVIGDDGAAEFLGRILKVVLNGVGLAGVLVGVEEFETGTGGERGSVPAHEGFETVGDVVDIDAIEHGLLVGVAADDVLIKEGEGIDRGSGGESDEGGIEVVGRRNERMDKRTIAEWTILGAGLGEGRKNFEW